MNEIEGESERIVARLNAYFILLDAGSRVLVTTQCDPFDYQRRPTKNFKKLPPHKK
jgi:hypothetical protein